MTLRRLLRLLGILLASLVVVALLVTLLFRLYSERWLAAAEERFREEAGPLELAAYAPADVPDPENVAAWMQAGAAAILVADEDRRLLAELDDRPAAEWSEQERERIETLLTELEPALTLLHRATGLTESSFGLAYHAGPTMPIPSGTKLLRASSLLAVEARVALDDGDLDRAVAAARSVERLAGALGHEPILLFAILEEAVSHRYALLLRSILQADPSEPLLVNMAADLHHRESLCSPLGRALAFDGAGAYASWGLGLTPVGGGFRMPWALRFLEPLLATRTLETFLILIGSAETPGSLGHLPLQQRGPSWPWNVYPMTFVPNVVDALARDKATGSALELARLAIAVRRTALADGRYPDSLTGVGDRPPAPSPLAGEQPLYELTNDSGVRLAYPEARRWWDEYEETESRRGELLVWELAPLAPRTHD